MAITVRPTCIAAVLLLATSPAAAAAGERTTPVSVDWAVDGAITGGALAVWIGSELAKDSLAPSSCRWCNAPGLDVSARNAVVWSNRNDAKTASDVLVFGVPAGVALYDGLTVGSMRAAGPDLLIIGEAVALTGVLTQATKFVAARQRPYAVYGTLPSKGADDRLSFFSGHASVAFSAAAAGGRLAQLRGDAAWPWVYGIGFTAAAATGYFRMAADKHWLTDVLAGAGAGTAIGLAVPSLHRNRSHAEAMTLSVVPSQFLLSGRF
jgi:membrane-associated phospholipid phosphatase